MVNEFYKLNCRLPGIILFLRMCKLRDHSSRYSTSLRIFFVAIACDMVGRCNYIVSNFT